MCAHREPSKTPRWGVISGKCVSCIVRLRLDIYGYFVDSSPSSRRDPPGSQSADLAVTGSSSKRKAALPSSESRRPQKIARTDGSHHPGRSMMEPEATPRTRDTFEVRSTTTSPVSPKRKRRKVMLPQNRDLLQRLLAPPSGTFTISSPSGSRHMLVSS